LISLLPKKTRGSHKEVNRTVQTITLQEAQDHLAEIIDNLPPGEEIAIVRDEKPIATIRGVQQSPVQPIPGRCKGMLTIVSEDEEHLKEFAEYLP
jgi:antitoxin (DNA-binding transcriptional repressor) of toxin-antitoxin stability system